MSNKEQLEYKNRKFIKAICQNKIPSSYRCSSCGDGHLEFIKGSFSSHETKHSLAGHDEDCWDYGWVELIFSGALRCRNCNESYVVSGTGGVDEDFNEIEGRFYSEYFLPKYFHPEIFVFEIPLKTPEAIRDIIISSFRLSWADFSASGNKLRVALELMVNDLISNPKANETLGNKINRIPNSHSTIRDMMNAIKWLGNEASHEAKLKECDLAFAFDTIELILKDLYPDEQKKNSILKHVGLVNTAKGSIAK